GQGGQWPVSALARLGFRLTLVGAVASVVHVGCAALGPGAETSPPTVASMTTAPPTAASPAPTSRGAGLDLCARNQTPCRLRAGEYRPRLFRPPVSFSLGDGWENLRYYADAFALGRRLPGGQHAGLSIGTVVEVFEDDERRTVPPGPVGFLLFLGALEGIKAQPLESVQIGGLSATQVDVELTGHERLHLFAAREDVFTLEPGFRSRLIALEVRGTQLVLVVDAPAASFAPFLPLADGVLASLRFE
ncbi:MAG: hypothetical protein M3301_02480, partial [Chloroflexota bacterium]|nr:hypothetical protein [Chloroflexota bacterium]